MRTYLTARMLGALLVAVIAVAAAAGLGLWQLDAWQTRRHDQSVDLTHRTPVPLTQVMGHDDPFPGRSLGQPVVVSGTWLPQATVFVSGRAHDGQDGYWVVTPLTDGGADSPAIPVVRGWTATPAQAPAAPTGPGTLVGWLQPSDDDPTVVDSDPSDDVVPALQIAALVQDVPVDLYSGYLVDADRTVTGPWPDGATAVNDGTAGLAPADLAALPKPGAFTAVRNLLYAIEWWFFGGFAAFIWWRFVRDERAASHEAADPAAAPADAQEHASSLES